MLKILKIDRVAEGSLAGYCLMLVGHQQVGSLNTGSARVTGATGSTRSTLFGNFNGLTNELGGFRAGEGAREGAGAGVRVVEPPRWADD